MKCSKLHIFLLFFLLSLFMFVPISNADSIPPTSRWYMTEERAQAIINYTIESINDTSKKMLFRTLDNTNASYPNYYNSTIIAGKDIVSHITAKQLQNYWNYSGDILTTLNTIQENLGIETIEWQDIQLLVSFSGYPGENFISFNFIICNNQSSDFLSYLKASFNNGNNISQYYINYQKQNSTDKMYTFEIIASGDYEFYKRDLFNSTGELGTANMKRYKLTNGNTGYFTSSGDEATISGLFGMSNYQIIYVDGFGSFFNSNYYNENLESGDNSGNIENTGTITNNSGETTDQIDLSGITNGIDNINNNITNSTNTIIEQLSGDTNKVVEAIGKQNENYWGTSGETTLENQSGEASAMIEDIYDNISGEITKNETIQALEEAEQGIINIYNYGRENPELLDFIISWNTTKYQGVSFISGDRINFSQMCRDIEELGTIQNYIRIIACFWASWSIIKQIYNLILSTLGIDNPYLYENEKEVTAIDADTGEYRQKIYRNRRIFRK